MFDAVLVANRGEIALRIIRACRELDVRAVAVYSEVDRDAMHVRYADEAHLLGPAPASESYLNTEKVLAVADQAGVDAIHPGYGFFSENADFAEAVRDAGFTFVGPPAEAMRAMGDKLSARAAAQEADAPVVPGISEPIEDPSVVEDFADEHGFPVAIKAAFGGGGRGMRVVRDRSGLRDAIESSMREAEASFGRGEVYVERYLERPRHIEFQIIGDLDGTVVHLGERDCSLQRRHQKLIEEAPAPGMTPELRERMGSAAVRIAEQVGYHNAGTAEFLYEPETDGFYFLEMNARLQVEHPVTELIAGIDLVHAQLRVAAGDGLGFTQDDVSFRGHAIEVRLNAEDPASNFSPGPGLIERFRGPEGPWVRLDGAAEDGWEIPRAYDSMFGKLIVWGEDRDDARMRMLRALDELVVEGIPTTIPFHRLALRNEMFIAGEHSTISVENEWDLSDLEPHGAAASSEDEDRGPGRDVTVEVDGRRMQVRVFGELAAVGGGSGGGSRAASRVRRRASGGGGGGTAAAGGADLVSPMQGTVVKYAVAEGDDVQVGDLVVVVEAMKMENNVTAHKAGVVADLAFDAGDTVDSGAVLARIEGDAGASGGADDGSDTADIEG